MKKLRNRQFKILISIFIFLMLYGIGLNLVRGQQSNWVNEIANQEGVHPTLVFAVMNQESHYRPYVVSPKGAIGLMQLLPDTARRFNVNPYNMQDNVRGGCRYLRFLLNKFGGRLDLALAGYNAGEGAVIKYGYQIPPYQETQNYVFRILSSLNMRANSSNSVSKQDTSQVKSKQKTTTIRKEDSSKKTNSSFLF